MQLQRQLDQFRSTQPRRTKLPEPLWQAAVELARQHGVYSVAHPLRLDYMRLKKRLGGVSILRREATKPAFVKLITPQRRRISGRRQDGYRTRHAPCRRPLPRVPAGERVLPGRARNAGEGRGARGLEANV